MSSTSSLGQAESKVYFDGTQASHPHRRRHQSQEAPARDSRRLACRRAFPGRRWGRFLGPVVLCESTTWEDFQRWLNVNEGRIRRWVFEPLADDPGRDRVVIYSLPSAVHESCKDILLSVIEQIMTLGHSIDLIDTVNPRVPTCAIGRAGQESDGNLTPKGLTVGGGVLESNNGAPFPNLVLETAYKNDDLGQLRTKLSKWVGPSTSVQVAIGIKIFSQPTMRLRRVALLHQRGQPAQEVEFGEDRHPGAAPLALTFPLASIYVGVALPNAFEDLIDPQISIDLIALRAEIDDVLAREQASRAAREACRPQG